MARRVAAHITGAARVCARSVTVNASPAPTAASRWVPPKPVFVTTCCVTPNQFATMERPTPTPNTSPRSCTRAFAVLATPDCRCSVASSRMPIVSAMPGRNVISAASVTTSAEALRPISTQAPAQKLAATAASGATIGSARAFRRVSNETPPTTSPTTAPATSSRQPPPSTGVTEAPASP